MCKRLHSLDMWWDLMVSRWIHPSSVQSPPGQLPSLYTTFGSSLVLPISIVDSLRTSAKWLPLLHHFSRNTVSSTGTLQHKQHSNNSRQPSLQLPFFVILTQHFPP